MDGFMNESQIDLMLRLVDMGIRAEIERICNTPVKQREFGDLITPRDMVLAHQMGISL